MQYWSNKGDLVHHSLPTLVKTFKTDHSFSSNTHIHISPAHRYERTRIPKATVCTECENFDPSKKTDAFLFHPYKYHTVDLLSDA